MFIQEVAPCRISIMKGAACCRECGIFKKTLRRAYFLVSGIALLIQASAVAESADALVQRALEVNPEFASVRELVDEAHGRKIQSGLWKNPEIDLEYGVRRTYNSGGELEGKGLTRGLGLKQTFEFPGKASLRRALAEKDLQLAELGVQQFRLSLEARVRVLALKLVLFRQRLDALNEVEGRGLDLVKVIQSKPLSGPSSIIEKRLIESSLLEIQREKVAAKADVESCRLELLSALDRSATAPLSPEVKIRPSGGLPSIQVLLKNTISRSPLLKMRQMELERSYKEVSAAKYEVAPDFVIGPFLSSDKAGAKEENVGASLSMKIPLWDWNQGNVKSAEARQRSAIFLQKKASLAVEAETIRLWKAIEGDLEIMAKPVVTLDQMRETADLADRHYRLGAVTVNLFIESQKQFIAALKQQEETLIRLWSHWAELEVLAAGDFKEFKS